jgi:DNA replication protein DnaC
MKTEKTMIDQKGDQLVEGVAKYIATQPQQTFCYQHQVSRAISLERSVAMAHKYYGHLVAEYEPCLLCEQERLHHQGVPKNLLHATLDNWESNGSEEHLQKVRDFVKQRAGFMIFLGDLGTGKSHLAVGAMRFFNDAYFVKQIDLLGLLRQTYRDRNAEDPVSHCKETRLLVLDDLGISGGGRDELPMLHNILDHRHGEKKPTIITTNFNLDQLEESVGPRLWDRLKESYSHIIKFAGKSYRSEARKNYFSNGSSGS